MLKQDQVFIESTYDMEKKRATTSTKTRAGRSSATASSKKAPKTAKIYSPTRGMIDDWTRTIKGPPKRGGISLRIIERAVREVAKTRGVTEDWVRVPLPRAKASRSADALRGKPNSKKRSRKPEAVTKKSSKHAREKETHE